MNIFDIAKTIIYKNKRLTDDEIQQYYDSFMINRILSYQSNCIIYVNEVNKFTINDNKMKYDFYYTVINRNKRKINWIKKDDIKDKEDKIRMLMEVYNYSYKKASEIYDILKEKDWNEIEKYLYKGGKTSL